MWRLGSGYDISWYHVKRRGFSLPVAGKVKRDFGVFPVRNMKRSAVGDGWHTYVYTHVCLDLGLLSFQLLLLLVLLLLLQWLEPASRLG